MKPNAFFLACLLLGACSRPQNPAALTPAALASAAWPEIVRQARGSEVTFAMWGGDDVRNRLLRGEIAGRIQQRYGITLRFAPLGDTAEAINKLLTEKAGGKTAGGSIDMVWINGENFRTAKEAGLLWGPFAAHVPNARLYPAAASTRDFGTPIEGFEVPWQRAQFVLACDTRRVPQPPASLSALDAWIRAHPGRFTYIAPPDFTGSAFVRHLLVHLGRRDPAFWTGFQEELHRRASNATIALLNEWRPYLWRRGETYPATLRELNRLFANQEVDFTMSYSPAFASVLMARGEFPPSTRTFVFSEGTLGNYNDLAIPFNSANPSGALVVINELLSFESALQLSGGLDQIFPLSLDALTASQREQVGALARGPATLPVETLDRHAIAEPDAQYLNRMEKDWIAKVLQQ